MSPIKAGQKVALLDGVANFNGCSMWAGHWSTVNITDPDFKQLVLTWYDL